MLQIKSAFGLLCLTATLSFCAGGAHGETVVNELKEAAEIKGVIDKYQDALNASDTESAMALYTDDAVVMPPGRQPMVGKDALRAAYQVGARSLKFNVKFDVQEVVRMAPNWAFARTQSAGSLTIDGMERPEANQELFVLERSSAGRWRISRYSFSSIAQVK